MTKHRDVTMADQDAVTGSSSPASGSAGSLTPVVPQNVEVFSKPTRRTFTAKFKREILTRVTACKGDGDIGKLLRQNGLFSSHLTTWKRELEARELAALEPRPRGPKSSVTESDREIAALRKENLALRARAERAEMLVDIQKKVALLLNLPSLPAESGH